MYKIDKQTADLISLAFKKPATKIDKQTADLVTLAFKGKPAPFTLKERQ